MYDVQHVVFRPKKMSSEDLFLGNIKAWEETYSIKNIIERITNKKIVVNNTEKYENIKKRVLEKNKMWLYDYKIPNGVHVYGRRYDPFGPDNYPKEIKKIRQLTDNRDKSIWAELSNKRFQKK